MNIRNLWSVVEIIALSIFLLLLGFQYFTHMSEKKKQLLALEVGMEQLSLFHDAHLRLYGEYAEFSDGANGIKWSWIDECEIEMRHNDFGHSMLARVDLDGDGRAGVWIMENQNALLRNIVKD